MKTERVDLYKHFSIKKEENYCGYLNCYVQDVNECTGNAIRPAMLILPGGAYVYTSPREEESVAIKFLSAGFNCFVLEYTCAPMGLFPTQLAEACLSMAYIRENAEKLRVDKEHVCAVGFSAGGHLCGSLATMWNCEEVKEIIGEKVNEAKPDGVILSYPVITDKYFNADTIKNVTGGDNALISKLSLEERVSPETVPSFIWTTMNDQAVDSMSTLSYALACKKNNVPFELHVFENGIHGLSVSSEETGHVNEAVAEWIQLSVTWLRNRGFKIKNER